MSVFGMYVKVQALDEGLNRVGQMEGGSDTGGGFGSAGLSGFRSGPWKFKLRPGSVDRTFALFAHFHRTGGIFQSKWSR